MAIGISPFAIIPSVSSVPPTTPLVLHGSGVGTVFQPWDGGALFRWWDAPDGSRVLLAAILPEGQSDHLGFATTLNAMAGGVESWIASLPPSFAATFERPGRRLYGRLVVVDTEATELPDKLKSVGDWNERYAYPRIISGADAELEDWLVARRSPALPVVRVDRSTSGDDAPDAAPGCTRAEESPGDEHRAGETFGPLARLVAPLGAVGANTIDSPLHIVARNIDTRSPGVLVFNTTPFRRTDVVALERGRSIVLTDIPPVGYAFAPYALFNNAGHRDEPIEPATDPSSLRLVNDHLDLELDRDSGAIRSLVTKDDQRQWVRSGSDGLNAVPGAILERVTRRTTPGVGTTLTARRWSPASGEVRSTVTVYEALPWIDIRNQGVGTEGPTIEYLHHFAMERPRVIWEIPAGYDEAPSPVTGVEYLRWLKLSDSSGTMLQATNGVSHTAVLHDGTLISAGSATGSSHRLLWRGPHVSLEDTWHFGMSAEPLQIVPVEPGAHRSLPRFGSLFVVDPPSAGLIGIRPASDGDGVIVYLLDMSGAGGLASLVAGVLRFTSARVVDLLERDQGEIADRLDHGVLVHVPARGAVAVHLSGLELNGT